LLKSVYIISFTYCQDFIC